MSDSGLKRQLGLLGVFSIAAGAMISSGLFVLPALAFGMTGPSVVLAYMLAGLLVIPSMLAKAELATAMPKAGGTYFFIERSLGSAAGVVGGISSWFSIAMKSAFALIGIGLLARLVFPGLPEWKVKLIAIGFCVAFTVLNLLSVKATSRFQGVLVLGLLAILTVYVIRGFEHVNVTHFTPFFRQEKGFYCLLATAGLVFVSYGGLTKVASVAEEVKDPGKTLPRGMILAFVVVNLFYLLVVFVTVGVLKPEALGDPDMRTPISAGAAMTMGSVGFIVVSVAAMLAFITTANAGILAASRSPMAMSRDHLLPSFLGRTSKRFGTPHLSILVTSGFMIVAITVLPLELLVKVASTMKILLFALVNLSLIVMRESRLPTYRPQFRSPFYPWLPAFGIIAYVALLAAIGLKPLLITLGFLVIGFIWYLVYVRIRVTRRSALLRVVERVTDREIAGDTLGLELREILLHRDNVIEDRFDHLIRECEILDLEKPASAEEVFREVSELLAGRLEISAEELHEMFVKRETSSSTIVRPGFAIPHVVVPGQKHFEVLLVRAREGITFTDAHEPVKVMFVLIGTKDERNYHLRALMAIAQIAQEPDFDRRWLSARNAQELRSILLLSNRERDVPGCSPETEDE